MSLRCLRRLSSISVCHHHHTSTSAFIRCFASIRASASVSTSVEFQPFARKHYYDAEQIAMTKQWKLKQSNKRQRLESGKKVSLFKEGSNQEVLDLECEELLAQPRLKREEETNGTSTTDEHLSEESIQTSGEYRDIELEVEAFSSTGDGLARDPLVDHVYVIPFVLAGERILANVRSERRLDSLRSDGDLIRILRPSPKREGVTPNCKYFGTCSGCQLQMIPYHDQLDHKRNIVEKAYRNFSGLAPHQIPTIGETGASPLQYHYRTKLTPHFDGQGAYSKQRTIWEKVPPIGFAKKGRKHVMDIESCPIGTEIVEKGLETARADVTANINTYKRGATILIRESTDRTYDTDTTLTDNGTSPPTNTLFSLDTPTTSNLTPTPTGYTLKQRYTHPVTFTDAKRTISDSTALFTEHIGAYKFTGRAGSFFQNNNSILPSFLTYVRSHCIPTTSNTTTTTSPPIKYLLDAYCGTGLFALTLSPLFTSVLGIDIDTHSITHARTNAVNNSIPNAGFIAADASDLFADVPYPADQTACVIDPPRKGCSVDFLRQLLMFGPKRVVYVSCNVHSQARDVGVLVRGGLEGEGKGMGGREGLVRGGRWRYRVEEVRGFDFFPQTGHVEGLCFLDRVEVGEEGDEMVKKEEVKVKKEEGQ